MFTQESLNIISVNFFSILFSLLNLVIIFLIAKFLLYKPVKKMLENRQKTIEDGYERASEAEAKANESRIAYEKKLEGAKGEADEIIADAVATAKARGHEIIEDSRKEGEQILKQAKENAELEIKRAEETIKDEIVDVSTALTRKLLEREINEKDHKDLIDSFIDEIGEE
jgi:F-type H+-transporting ATPase subunit b